MQIHARRAANEWSRKSAVPESMESTVQTVEALMEVLEELPEEWVQTSRVYKEMEDKQGRSPSRRTIRRWINKLETEGYLKKRGNTRDSEIYSMVEK